MPPRVLPYWPHILFGILEPVALIMGFYAVFSSPQSYHNAQVPSSTPNLTITPGTTIITLQLGNVFLLLAGLAVLCTFTPHPEIARWYLIIVAVADLGHIYSSYAGMGYAYFWDVASWNDMAWGNVGTSVFLCVNRIATVLGIFGQIKNRAVAAGRKRQ